MTELGYALRSALYPFLAAVAVLLLVVFLVLLAQRGIAGLRARRRDRIQQLYQPVVAQLVAPGGSASALASLANVPPAHLDVVGDLLLAPLAVSTGETTAAVRTACVALGLDGRWREALSDRHWWRRTEAARALGLIEDQRSVRTLIARLDDEHDEVRAAAVDALAGLRHPEAMPALTSLLASPSRHQRARVVEALRRQGAAAVPILLDRARSSAEDAVTIVELLGLIRAQAATADLVEWLSTGTPALKAAAMGALGTIGLDDRTYYYALRALADPVPAVRAGAARALGRTGRADSGEYLAPLLDDEWSVAASAATALRQLGATGIVAFERRAGEDGQAGDLARQMLWERRTFTRGAP